MRPFVLSIAGFDPSSGAGITADLKAMEQIGVYGLGVCTAVTVQHEDIFKDLKWLSPKVIKEQLLILLSRYPIEFAKVGIIENWQLLADILSILEKKKIKVIWDPVLRASAGFDFHKKEENHAFQECLKKVFLLTPNTEELNRLSQEDSSADYLESIRGVTALYLKGGHSVSKQGEDILYFNNEKIHYPPKRISSYEKHGSGCVLSAAVTAYLALKKNLPEAAALAKDYTLKFLESTPTKLGYHAPT